MVVRFSHSVFAVLGLALAVSFAAAPAKAQGPANFPVVLKPRVVVEGEMVRLGDLFDGATELESTTVARAPEPGHRVEVDARWLAAVAQAYGLGWQPKSRYDTVTVERASTVIETAQIEAATIDALAERGARGRISVAFDNPAMRLHLPVEAQPTLSIAGLSYDPSTGRFSGQIVAPASGAPLVRTAISGRAVEMTDVPALVRRVEPGEIINQRDVHWVSVRADRLTGNTIASQERLFGKSPRRPLRAGEPILASDLREPVLVEKNSIVTIRLETPRMVLTAEGRALDQGAAGDVVRVMNTHSKKIINATVEQSGDVRVYIASLAASQ